MTTLTLSLAPADGVAVPAGLGSIFVDAVYTRTLTTADKGLGDLAKTVQDTVRTALDDRLRGALALADLAPASTIELDFLAGNGTVRLAKTVKAGDGNSLAVTMAKDEVARITAADPQPDAAAPLMTRRAYFIAVSDVTVPFEKSKLQIAPIRVGDGRWPELGLDHIFNSEVPLTTAVQWDPALMSLTGEVTWTPIHVGVAGQFAFTVPADSGDAWLWWLSGPRPALGAVIDDLSKVKVTRQGIALPAFPGGEVPVDEGPTRVPATVTEAELVDNPEVYSEDPGSFCQPFKNPERVLGERSFSVIFRVEQPVISAEATVRKDPLPVLTSVLAAAQLSTNIGFASAAAPSRIAVPGAIVDADAETAFSRHTLPTSYFDVLRSFGSGRTEMSATHPMQWDGDSSRYQAVTVARGHILEFRMRWRSNGYSLGTVAKTLTLAPRQARRIEKIEWRRTETARREESTRLFDQVSDSVTRDRTYDDAVQANLSEWSRGESSSNTVAAAGGFGFVVPPFVVGGGGGGSHASSTSSQEGGRSTSASEEQKLRDSIRRYGDALRKLDSLVVNEVSQEETATGTTEVVRNLNYGHSLTVIYYQILRHLRVETNVVGVRECLFVPFAITPFTVARAYRWREAIQKALRDTQYGGAIRFLKDVLTNFAQSDVPPGRRSDQPVRFVHGSLYLSLAIDRPRDKDDGTFDTLRWAAVQPFLGTPALGIWALLKGIDEAQRDALFQKQHAPTIAANWANTLKLDIGGPALPADFTLATRYSFNSGVRVDFSIAVPSGMIVTREMLAALHVKASKALPPGSVANLQRVTFNYQTDHFQRNVSAQSGTDDLIDVETGVPDAGALATSIPDEWERRDVRLEMTRAVQTLVEHLNEHVEYYTNAVIWNMDRNRLFMLIDGFYVPGTSQVSIASVVERDPIAIIGNSIVFRVCAGSFLGFGSLKTPADLLNYYVSHENPTEPMLISLPTDGLYAQTVMDDCPALEEHLGNTDWVLNDPDPTLSDIAPELLASRRAEPQPTTPTPLPATIINLQNAPDAPAPSGLAGVLSAVTTPNAFRDMAGLAGTQANAASALQVAANLATNFGNQAAQLKLAQLAKDAHATATADQKLATVQRAADKNLVPQEVAQDQATKILDALHSPDSDSPTATRDAAITHAVFAAADSGLPFTVEHVAMDGTTSVSTGGGGGGGGSGSSVPAWADAIDLFPSVTLPTFTDDAALNTAAQPVTTTAKVKDLCAALVDLTGNPASPAYVGLNDKEMLFSGSLSKVYAMYAAFALKDRVQAFIDAAKANGAPVTSPDITAAIDKAWRPKLKALFPNRPEKLFITKQDIVVPRLDTIFDFSASGQVTFKDQSISDAALDAAGEFGTPPGRFNDWMKLMTRWSNNTAAGKVIDAVGYFYINGALGNAGFFDATSNKGLWLSADYAKHDWVSTQAEKDANAGGQALTVRWATAQGRAKSNITATAQQCANLMTLMAQDKLVDATSSQAMRTLLAGALAGIGSYIKDALDADGRAFTSLAAKKGFGDDSFSHECGIVERTVAGKNLRYAVVGLGSPPAQGRADLSKLFQLLDQAVVARH